jgi:hypothetical protein
VFVAPFIEEIHFLAGLGEVTSLTTSCQKSLALPIRFESLDLNDILQHFMAKRSTSPMLYLSLPISMHHLGRIYVQHLEDKIAGKLGSQSSKNVTFAGRRVLVRVVLTSQAIYHITSLDLSKEVLKRLEAHTCGTVVKRSSSSSAK